MRKIYLSLIALAMSCTVMAQITAIGNGGMEDWDNVGSNTEEPKQWNSNKNGSGYATFGPKTCTRDGNPHSGSYCAKVTTGSALGNVVNGSLTTGKVEAPSTTKAQGYISSQAYATDTNYRMRFTGRPDSLVFWIKYTPADANDKPRVEARLHVGNAYAPEAPVSSNHPDSTVNIIARAAYLGSPGVTIGSWTRVSLPFTYVDNRTPKFILISTTSSGDQTAGADGSIMYLDDFEAIYNPTVAVSNPKVGTYYVNATTGAAINVPFTLTGNYGGGNVVSALLSDASGSFAQGTSIGTIAKTVSDSVAGTIPAGTASGSAYRVKVATSAPVLNSAANTNNINIVLTTVSIAPSTAQTIEAGKQGSQLTATATAGSTGSQWKYSTSAGGPYTSFSPAQTGGTYTPSFAISGTYYVVNEALFTNPNGILTTRSNEVQINAVANSIAPASPQSLLVNVAGSILTVTESSTATGRTWKYATTPGGSYTAFSPAQTGTTYTPLFAAPGTYYVVCQSVINGVTVTSNEVIVSVGSVTLNTTAVTGFPIDFSPSAPNKAVTVTYTVAGGSFVSGNTFTAQLSDATGAFTSPVNIGIVNATTSGTINATVPNTTPGGANYRIRVIASNPAIQGGDNGIDLFIDQFNNSVSSAATQTIAINTSGNFLNVTESQNASREWKYSTTAGGTFVSFSPVETTPSYIPFFTVPGTYYVAAFSKNQYNDVVKSNEVTIIVTNGTTLTTGTVTNSPYLVSPKANVQVAVPFTSNIVFNSGNVFTAQLSDASGSFASPVTIGTLSGTSVGTINTVIPNGTNAGTGYRIRVVSSDPAAIGTDNGTDLEVIPFEISVSPNDTAFLVKSVPGSTITLSSTHPATYHWLYTSVSGLGYTDFTTVQTSATINPSVDYVGRFFLTCRVVNAVDDTLSLPDLVMIVSNPLGIDALGKSFINTYFSSSDFVVDMSKAELENATVELFDVAGKKVVSGKLQSSTVNRFAVSLPAGNYLYSIRNGNDEIRGKASKK